jgi:hypothetical protein
LTPDDMHMQASALKVDIKPARSVPLDHGAAPSEHTGCDAFFISFLLCFTKQA